MISNLPQLKKNMDILAERLKKVELELSFLKRGETLPPSEPPPDPGPKHEPINRPQGGTRHWGSGAGQMDAFTSYRRRKQ